MLGFNFRPDRMREITQALADPEFDEIDRGGAEVVERYATLAEYDEDWDYPVVFPPRRPKVTLAQVIADRGLRQLHVAETEKYPHVTYFFNGGEEDEHEGETFTLVPSPRDVPTYDKKPEMSAYEAAAALVDGWKESEPAFAIINFANADMVGHTGVIEAAVAAVEAVDECLGRVLEAVHAQRRRLRRHRRPRQRGRDARGGRVARHRALAQPGAVRRHRGRRVARRLGGDPGRRRAHRPGAARDRAARGDDGPLAAGLSATGARLPFSAHDHRAQASPVHELSPTELGAWRGLLRVHSALVKALDAELLAAHGLPLTSYEVLINLQAAPGRRRRMAELAEDVLLSRSGTTRLVDRLERDGLLERDVCDSDGRGCFAVLTDKGEALLTVARATHLDGVRARFLSHFEPAEFEQMTAWWERVLPGAGAVADLSPCD